MILSGKLRKIQIFFTDFCFWSKREDVLHFLRISELYLPVCLANPETYQCGFFHGILFKTTRLNFWKRDRRQSSNKDKIATFMAEAEIIIKSWNPKMAKNQVSHFLVTGKKEPPNLVSLPCSVCILFAETDLFYFYFLFNLILIFKDGWIQLCRTKCLSFT